MTHRARDHGSVEPITGRSADDLPSGKVADARRSGTLRRAVALAVAQAMMGIDHGAAVLAIAGRRCGIGSPGMDGGQVSVADNGYVGREPAGGARLNHYPPGQPSLRRALP